MIQPASAYTGCRGRVVPGPEASGSTPSPEPLGYYVAIDGENGRARPFLARDLELLRAARVAPGRARAKVRRGD